MNTEGQEMETYKIFVVLMGNTKITKYSDIKGTKYSVTPNNNKEKEMDDLDDKEAPNYSILPSDKKEKVKEDLVAPNTEKDKTTK